MSEREHADEAPGVGSEVRRAFTEAASSRSERLAELLHSQYPVLRRLAARLVRSAGNGFSPSSVVHEAFLLLVDQPRVAASTTQFFLACAAQACRQALVALLRERRAMKRGGGQRWQPLPELAASGFDRALDLVDLSDAIDAYAAVNPRGATIAVQAVFGGLRAAEIAAIHGLGETATRSELHLAAAWLHRRLAPPAP